MTRILFILYHSEKHHSRQLVRNALKELEGLEYIEAAALGTVAKTINSYDTGDADWVIAWDPHFRWMANGAQNVKAEILTTEGEIPNYGAITFPVVQYGPQEDGWDKFLKEIPLATYRLLVAFRVAALKSIGGFKEASSGRNWLMATEWALYDQGWRIHREHPEAVAIHSDPDLTLPYFLQQAYWAGRDMAQLWTRHRGHPLIGEELKTLVGTALIMEDHNTENTFYKTWWGMRLLGALEGLGKQPQSRVRAGVVETRVHLDKEEKK